MKRIISLLIALLLINNYLISQPEQKDIIKEADLLLDMMEYKAAINSYLKALSEDPKQLNIRKNIGYAYFRLKKINEALKFLHEEIELFPDNRDARVLLMYILSKNKRGKEAFNFYKRHDFPTEADKGDPNYGLGDFIAGMYFKEQGELDKARVFFERTLERGYYPKECYKQLADIELITNKLRDFYRVVTEAKENYKKLYRIDSKSYEFFDLNFMYGLLYYQLFKNGIGRNFYWLPAHLTISFNYFKEALNLKPNSKDTLFNLGCIQYNFGQFGLAAEYFERILEIEPENADIKLYLDCCHKNIAQLAHEESISAKCPEILNLTRSFIQKPDVEYQYQFKNDILFILQNINYLALEYIRRGKLHDAMRRYRNGIEIYSESPEINFNLGMIYFWQSNFKEAEKHALIALRRKDFFATIPDFFIPEEKVFGERVAASISRLEREELFRKYRHSSHKSPDIPLSEWNFNASLKEGNYFLEAYDLLGNIYFKKGEFAKSVLAYKKVIELKHDDAMGHYNLGCAYWSLDDWQNAEKEWKEAIKYEEKLKRVSEREKISQDQLEISLIVLKRPVSFKAHKSLGGLYLEQGLIDKALKEFKKAVELEPGDPESYYALGKIYQARKNLKKAIFHYEKYLYLGGKEEAKVKEILKSLKEK